MAALGQLQRRLGAVINQYYTRALKLNDIGVTPCVRGHAKSVLQRRGYVLDSSASPYAYLYSPAYDAA